MPDEINGVSLAVLTRLAGVTSVRHEDCIKGFTQASRSSYHDVWLEDEDHKDSFLIGFYDEDEDGTTGEFQIEFKILAGSLTPLLRAFADSWNALLNMPELLIWLGQNDDNSRESSVTPEQFRQALVEMGFKDRSVRERVV